MKVQDNLIKKKSFHFALAIISTCKKLNQYHRQYEISNQLLRSGTVIGALVAESEFAESRKDFRHKLCIALKEAGESKYWLEILHHMKLIEDKNYTSIIEDNQEILRLLISITKTLKYP
jgi:four helix bundle protein